MNINQCVCLHRSLANPIRQCFINRQESPRKSSPIILYDSIQTCARSFSLNVLYCMSQPFDGGRQTSNLMIYTTQATVILNGINGLKIVKNSLCGASRIDLISFCPLYWTIFIDLANMLVWDSL